MSPAIAPVTVVVEFVDVARNTSALPLPVKPTVWLAAMTLSAWPDPKAGSLMEAPSTVTQSALFQPALARSVAEKLSVPSAAPSDMLLSGEIAVLL